MATEDVDFDQLEAVLEEKPAVPNDIEADPHTRRGAHSPHRNREDEHYDDPIKHNDRRMADDDREDTNDDGPTTTTTSKEAGVDDSWGTTKTSHRQSSRRRDIDEDENKTSTYDRRGDGSHSRRRGHHRDDGESGSRRDGDYPRRRSGSRRRYSRDDEDDEISARDGSRKSYKRKRGGDDDSESMEEGNGGRSISATRRRRELIDEDVDGKRSVHRSSTRRRSSRRSGSSSLSGGSSGGRRGGRSNRRPSGSPVLSSKGRGVSGGNRGGGNMREGSNSVSTSRRRYNEEDDDMVVSDRVGEKDGEIDDNIDGVVTSNKPRGAEGVGVEDSDGGREGRRDRRGSTVSSSRKSRDAPLTDVDNTRRQRQSSQRRRHHRSSSRSRQQSGVSRQGSHSPPLPPSTVVDGSSQGEIDVVEKRRERHQSSGGGGGGRHRSSRSGSRDRRRRHRGDEGDRSSRSARGPSSSNRYPPSSGLPIDAEGVKSITKSSSTSRHDRDVTSRSGSRRDSRYRQTSSSRHRNEVGGDRRSSSHRRHHRDDGNDHRDRDGSDRYHKSSSSRRRERSRSYEERRKAEEEKRKEELKVREELRRKQEEERLKKEEEEKKKKEVDEARRDDMTVLLLNLSLKATERDVWKFISENAGKVRDIQVIRDSRSGKSKGVGYVEFYTQEAVLKALSLSGQCILGVPVRIQSSQAEKNRAAKAAKQQAAEITEAGPMKIYVGGLVDNLSTITSDELRQLFSPFGDIVAVDLHKDPYTGRCKGYGFVQFRHAQDAREAMSAMNGFEIAGRQIKVGYATDPNQRQATSQIVVEGGVGVPLGNNLVAAQNALQAALSVESQQDNERLDDEGGGLMSGVTPRISLMQKLQRLDPASLQATAAAAAAAAGVAAPGMTLPVAAPLAAAAAAAAAAGVQPAVLPFVATPSLSSNVCLEGMFTPAEAAEEGPSFFDDVGDDVRSECSKYGAVMEVWLNRRVVDGKVWVKFGGMDQAVKAYQALNGRYFGGNQIKAIFVPEALWIATCVLQQG